MPFSKVQFPDLLILSNNLNNPPYPSQQSLTATIKQQTTPPYTISNAISTLHSPNLYVYPQPVCVNWMNQRVDDFFPEPTSAVATQGARTLREHMNRCKYTNCPPPCNEWNLIGECKASNCRFDHQNRLLLNQCVELAKLARKSACIFGSACRNPTCIYAHLCPHDADGDSCGFGNEECRLGMFHGIDTSQIWEWRPTNNLNRFPIVPHDQLISY